MTQALRPPLIDESPQSPVAAHLRAAREAIDLEFGEGYAAANPGLVAALVQAGAIEAAVAAGKEAHRETIDVVQVLSRNTNETLLKLKPRIFG